MTPAAPARTGRPMQAVFRVQQPALSRYRRHVLYGNCSGCPRTCDLCRQLHADASAESWQRTGGR